MARQTRARIHRTALRQNYQLAQNKAPNSQTIAVVKANAYGHGLEGVVATLDDLVPAYAVATIDEGLYLRRLSDKPILILEGVLRADELIEATHHKLILMVHHESQVALLEDTQLHQAIQLWLKHDAGMHRLGLSNRQLLDAYERLARLSWVQQGFVIAGHLANGSEPQHPMNKEQQQSLLTVAEQLAGPVKLSLANSAAILSNPDSCLDWNRPGIMLYGGAPFDDIHHDLASDLKPAMTLESEVLAVRELSKGEAVGYGSTWQAKCPSRIATIGIGYADGYSRHIPSGTPVAINGQIGKLIGRVSMDMITVDVTELGNVNVGDHVELWGETVSVNTVAQLSDTISYELTSLIAPRVPRILVD